MDGTSPENYDRRIDVLTLQAAEELRLAAGSIQHQRLACCRYFRRGELMNATYAEMVDLLGVSSPSVLEMAGYSDVGAQKVMEMIAGISDGEIHRNLRETIYRVTLLETEGSWLAAVVQLGEQRLCVMDQFTDDDLRPGDEYDVKISAGVIHDGESWEDTFNGNPERKKTLEPISGWSYRAFGEIVDIDPVIVDCGILFVDGVFDTHDPRVIGEFVAFTISRLDAAAIRQG